MYSNEEYESWNKKKFTNTIYLFLVIENICKSTFLYHLFPMEQLNLYTFSIIFLQIRTILFLIILMLSFLYMICMFVSKSKRKIQPIQEIKTTEATEATEAATEPQDTKIEFTSLNECSICIEINYNQVIITDCNHEFHEKCLFEWMKNSPTCPICRKQLVGT
jgi:magnesium-transporting ATPase (P-type)